MMTFPNRRSTTFVYVQNASEDFWVFAKDAYHRFIWRSGCIRYVRSQPQLPPCAEGSYLQVNDAERHCIEQEAAQAGIRLDFFSSDSACNLHVSREEHSQYIFDRVPPAASFPSGEEIGRRKKA